MPMTQQGWETAWIVFLVIGIGLFFIAFGLLEWGSYRMAKRMGLTNTAAWTLSETVRRWSAKDRWIPSLVTAVLGGGILALIIHLFAQMNP